jgi:hypothetical protein
VISIWEHEFYAALESNPEMKDFCKNLDLQDHLNPRDAFFGGRTNATRLYHEVEGDEKIQYFDYTSLYPWTNKYQKYPCGHAQVIVKDFDDLSNYFGMAKIKILPPRKLFHPVLPRISQGKLKFALCAKCADEESKDTCRCNDNERALIGTWCTPEIQKARDVGYKVLEVYQVYHWDNTSKYDPLKKEGGLFSEFINCFLKIKQENSGWPAWVQSDEDKAKYIALYEQNEGIKLQAENIEYNAGRRSLSKLILNSFWGKYGQRSGLKKAQYARSEAEFLNVLCNPTTNLHDFFIISENLCSLTTSLKSDHVEECLSSNIFIAAFTTCWARLKLYEVLETAGEDVLYYDTDSCIFIERSDTVNRIQLGDYLGQLTSELNPGTHIERFVSAGPKNYAYVTSDGTKCCKIKGFTLNYANSQLLNFDRMQDIVRDHPEEKITLPPRTKICRDKNKHQVFNKEEDRIYSMVYTKRRRLDNFRTEPYGY